MAYINTATELKALKNMPKIAALLLIDAYYFNFKHFIQPQ